MFYFEATTKIAWCLLSEGRYQNVYFRVLRLVMEVMGMASELNSDNWSKITHRWKKLCAMDYGENVDRANRTFSEAGDALKRVYTPLDIEEIKYDEIGMPGIFPFTRGTEPLRHEFDPIKTWIFFGYGLPEETRERMELYLKTPGFSQISIATDMATYYGYDPDHPLARGRVGQSGTSMCNVQDLAGAFDGIALENFLVSIHAGISSSVMLALLIVYAERHGILPDKLKGYSPNKLFKGAFGFQQGFPPMRTIAHMIDLIKYCVRNMPNWNVMTLDGYIIREQGANAIQELAFMMALSVFLTKCVVEGGLTADDFLSKVVFKLNANNDFFEEVAKFRAFRKIWAKTNRERFGCTNPKSLQPGRMVIQTGGSTLTAQQPLNNIIRATVQTLAAVVGGIPFVDTAAYDEALCIPTKESETVALRTGQILFHESNVKNVIDPMGGSYYVEYLTKRIEEEVYKTLEEIEKQGGFIKCWESGWFRRQIEQEAYKWKEGVAKKTKIVVGVNKYVTGEETQVPVFRVDPRVEKTMVERVKEFRKKRDNSKVAVYLDRLRKVVKDGGELMPALIEAARADATLGEMMDVLRREYGWQVHR
jgi:methylmalonyl-CoA mutase N-terminal domain/subunit